MKKHFFTIFIFCNLLTISMFAQVGINTTSPNNNSILDLDSNDKGLLIPRLTKAEMSALDATLTSTDAGMLVYCTDLNLFCYYNGTDWISMPAWGQKVDLSDPTAEQNISPTIMNSNSGVGIGTTDPQSKFTVVGNLAVGKDSIAPTDGAYINGKVRMGDHAGISNQLEVGGSINARGKIKENGYALVPAGTIVLWYGSTVNIPDGWAWCNGGTATWETGVSFTTPNLSGRFVMGAGNRGDITLDATGNVTTGLTYNHNPNEKGGYDMVALNLEQMPEHNHFGNTGTGTPHKHGFVFTYASGMFAPNDSGGGGADDDAFALGECENTGFTCDPSSHCEFSNLGVRMTSAIQNESFHTHGIQNQGGNIAHKNLPPYYVLAYIIKL